MSRIKMLFAEVNGDDDLIVSKPKEEKTDTERLKLKTKTQDALVHHIGTSGVDNIIKDFFIDHAEMADTGDKMVVGNFATMCELLSKPLLDTAIETYQIDMDDSLYNELKAWVTNYLIIEYDSFSDKIAEELTEF